jgi:hypothetical protein
MSSPRGPSITCLKAVRKQVSDAAAAFMAWASEMANHAATAAANTKAAFDDTYTAAIKVAKAAHAANAAHNGPPLYTNNANPTTAAMSAPRATINGDDSDGQSPTPRPTQPEDNSLFFQLMTVLANALYFLICIARAAGTVLFTWKILMFARAAVHSLRAYHLYLALFCTAFAVSFATSVWLRTRRRKVTQELGLSWSWPRRRLPCGCDLGRLAVAREQQRQGVEPVG